MPVSWKGVTRFERVCHAMSVQSSVQIIVEATQSLLLSFSVRPYLIHLHGDKANYFQNSSPGYFPNVMWVGDPW